MAEQLNPPEHALVLCVDEKTYIQAWLMPTARAMLALAPVSGVRRLPLSRHAHYPSRQTGRDRGSTAGPGGIAFQSRHAQSQNPATPARYFLGRDLHRGRDLFVLPTFGEQHDQRTLDHWRRKRPAASPLLQGGLLIRTQGDGMGDPHPATAIQSDVHAAF
jgi:hypothetical protein